MEEDLETAELKEKIDEHVEHHEHAHGDHGGAKPAAPKWTTYLSVSTALIAVLAACASLLSGSNSNEAILNKSEAMLAQSQASDKWAYYQAKSVKQAIAQRQSELIVALKGDADTAGKLAAAAKKYEAEEDGIKREAEHHEDEVKEANERTEALMEKHHRFAITVTLLQIAIALSAIAALTKRKAMWFVGLAAAAGGAAMFVWGLAS